MEFDRVDVSGAFRSLRSDLVQFRSTKSVLPSFVLPNFEASISIA